MRKVNKIYELIGQTPIVKINNLVAVDSADVYLKLESFNPGSSVKDRIALSMIEAAERDGILAPGDTIIESTSGNTGIGLAMIAASKGYKAIFTMPESMSIERRQLLQIYGAELILTPKEKGMTGSNEKAQELADEHGYFMVSQFTNPNNLQAHIENTGPEIISMFDQLDAFVAGVGTGGTITGNSQVLKQHYSGIEIVAVEPKDSSVLSGAKAGPHGIQGIGAGFVPDILNQNAYDSIIRVADHEAIETTRLLAKKEGVLCGISTGAATFAALQIAKKLGKGKTVLAIAPDTGERYLSTKVFQ